MGAFKDVVRLLQRPISASPDLLPLQRRGRQGVENEMHFGSNCEAGVRFIRGGQIQGWISMLEDVVLTSERVAGPGALAIHAWEMRERWNVTVVA